MSRRAAIVEESYVKLLALLTAAAEHGERAPSNADLAERLGFNSIASPARMLQVLERNGLIRVERFARSRIVTICATGKATRLDGRRTPHRFAHPITPIDTGPAPRSAPGGFPASGADDGRPDDDTDRARDPDARHDAARDSGADGGRDAGRRPGRGAGGRLIADQDDGARTHGAVRALPTEASGMDYATALRREAATRGIAIRELLADLTGNPADWLRQLEHAQRPKPATIARILAVLDGETPPPPPANNFQSRSYQIQPRTRALGPERSPPMPVRTFVDRTPCPRCGTRGDLGCAHQRPYEERVA